MSNAHQRMSPNFSNVLSVIMGGGQGSRLFPLTRDRSKPAVPLAGKYRLVDIPISNCINSGLKRVYLLTQFNSASLHRHISQSYKFDHFSGGFVEIVVQQVAEVFANGVGGSLVPGGVGKRLLSREDFHKAAGEVIELVGLGYMPMERG